MTAGEPSSGELRGSPAAAAGLSDRRLALISLAGGLLVGAFLSFGAWAALRGLAAPAPVTHDLVIPAGTAELIAAGGAPPAIPASLHFREEDSLRIRNEDSVPHRIDRMVVAAGEESLLPVASIV